MKTYVCGHRNPDVDSVMSAFALADLRRRTGLKDVEALCAGRIPPKAKWVIEHFGIKGIRTRRDVYVRVRDLIDPRVPAIDSNMRLDDALRLLAESGESSLPVKEYSSGAYLGMLSPAKLLHLFLNRVDLSIQVSSVPLHHETPVFVETDRVHDVKASAIRNAHNHFPVVNEAGVLIGTILKRAFAERPPFRMILVDHNEAAQGIPGVEELPIVEVVDHHRIAFAPTVDPIKYTADVVGATCTLVAELFRAAQIQPTKEVAAAMLAGVVSDTLLFQSPTTTDTDRSICGWLEQLAGMTSMDMMTGLMSVQSPLVSLSPEKAIAIDAKTYTEGWRTFVLAQVEESHMTVFHQLSHALREAMDRAVAAGRLDFMALMVTDPVSGNSELLFSGNEAVRRALPYRRGSNGTFLMPGVLSRKKQLLPEILAAMS